MTTAAYKLREKLQKGYVLTTKVPSWEGAYSEQLFGNLRDGRKHYVDLTGVSPMFKVVHEVMYEDGVYKGFRKDAFVMTVPNSVIEAYYQGGAL
jgi:hypothetical protein